MKITLDVDVDERVVSDRGGYAVVVEELRQITSMFLQPKRAIRDIDFSDPAKKPSFKQFLLHMPDGDLDYEMGVKAPE